LATGILLGNLGREMRDFLGKAAPALIPFFAFAIGASLNLANARRAGLLELVLGAVVLAISSTVMFLADRVSGGKGVAWLAAAATAGNAAANPAYAAAAPFATVLVAAGVVATMLSVPLVTAWWARKIASNSPSDFMEPLRSFVNCHLLQFATAETFAPGDFTISQWGECRLNPQMGKTLVTSIAGFSCRDSVTSPLKQITMA
jgi:hypothetical protein